MARLSERERQELKRLAEAPRETVPWTAEERYVAATPEARMRYIRFATRAARFYRGDKPVRFRGNNWKL